MATPETTKENDNDSANGSAIFNDFMQRRSSTLKTIFGKIRHYDNIEKYEWIFLAVGLLSAIVSLGFTIERMISLDVEKDTNDFHFAILLAVNILFCMYFVLRGVLQERPLEIFVFVVTNLIVTIYVIINYSIQSHHDTTKLVRLVLTIMFGSINIALGVKFFLKYWGSDNYVFRITPVPDLQRICRIFLWCEGFLVFDIQFQISVLILVLNNVVAITSTERVVLIIGAVFIVPWLIIGYLALRYENKILCYIFWVLCLLSPGIITYKFTDAQLDFTPLKILYSVTVITGVSALLIRLLLVISTVVAYRNFDKGYKDLRFGTQVAGQESNSEESNNHRFRSKTETA